MRKWVRVPERGDRPSRACRGRGGSHIGGLGRVIYCVQSYTSSTVAPTPLASRARLKAFTGAKCDIGAFFPHVCVGATATMLCLLLSSPLDLHDHFAQQFPVERFMLVPAALLGVGRVDTVRAKV